MAEYYLLIKTLHIISVIYWMAGMLYLPRLFVYHTQEIVNSKAYKKFVVMEKRLLKIIIMPAMLSSLLFGVLLLFITDSWLSGWMHGKFTFIFILLGLHGMLSKFQKKFATGTNDKSEKFFRVINEIPAFCIIFIVVFAVMKPF